MSEESDAQYIMSKQAACMNTACVHETQLHQAPRYACVGVMHIWLFYLHWAHAVDAVHGQSQ